MLQSPLCGVEGRLPSHVAGQEGASLEKGVLRVMGGKTKKEAGGSEGDFRRRDLPKKDFFLVTRFTRKTLCCAT